jgi:lysophospholipid acyltransferase (LPLAT)-like uncharacterized protein
VLLARNTGAPLVAFHVAMERAWIVRSWDALIIPKPFSHGVVFAQGPISVPPDANDEVQQKYLVELQRRLDSARDSAEKITAPGELV